MNIESDFIAPHQPIDGIVAVEHLEQSHYLVDRLAVVGLIEKPVQLRRRCSEPTHDFSFRERTGAGSLLCFDGEPVEQKVPQTPGILVVLEHLFHVHRPAAAGVENIGERFQARLVLGASPE